MPLVLFAACLLIFGLALFLGPRDRDVLPFPTLRVSGGVVMVVILAMVAKAELLPLNQNPAEAGLLFGAAAAFIAYFSDRLRTSGAIALGLACAVSGALLLIGKVSLDYCCLAAVVGCGTVAVCCPNRTSSFTAVTVAAVSLAQLLSISKSGPPAQAMIAPIGICGAALIAGCGIVLGKVKTPPYVWPATACILSLATTAGIAKICFPGEADWLGLPVIPIAAIVIYLLDNSSVERPRFSAVLATVIWIGLATVAFGLARGMGIGAAYLVGAGLLVCLESERAIISSGPLLALVLYRSFRLEHAGVSGAIDIGQHYALIGFALGSLIPLLPFEWLSAQSRLKEGGQVLGTYLWLWVCFSTPCLIALFLAPKGLLGFVTGLGFCGFFALADSKFKLSVVSLAVATGALAIMAYGSVHLVSDLSREQKIHWFILSAIYLAIVAGILGAIGAFKSKETLSSGAL